MCGSELAREDNVPSAENFAESPASSRASSLPHRVGSGYSPLLLDAISPPCITTGHRLAVHAEHFRCGLIRCACRVEIALLHGIAVAVVAILFDFLLWLAFRRIGDDVVRVRCLLNGLRLLRRIHRLNVLRRLGDYVFLCALLVGVIGAGGDEEQRAAKPDLLRVVGQVADANAPWRLDDHIARALWAIPVTT